MSFFLTNSRAISCQIEKNNKIPLSKPAKHGRDGELLKLFILALITFNERIKVEMKHFSISIYDVQVLEVFVDMGYQQKNITKLRSLRV